VFLPSVYTSQDPVIGTCTFTLEFTYNFFVIFKYTTNHIETHYLVLTYSVGLSPATVVMYFNMESATSLVTLAFRTVVSRSTWSNHSLHPILRNCTTYHGNRIPCSFRLQRLPLTYRSASRLPY
jgi:hypothetical protein